MKLMELAVNFSWSRIGYVEDARRLDGIVDHVSSMVLDIGFKLPESITLFNPASTLSWLLGERYVQNQITLSQ